MQHILTFSKTLRKLETLWYTKTQLMKNSSQMSPLLGQNHYANISPIDFIAFIGCSPHSCMLRGLIDIKDFTLNGAILFYRT